MVIKFFKSAALLLFSIIRFGNIILATTSRVLVSDTFINLDAAGMGVDVGDIEVVMQWKVARHTTLATLWQRIGRAGRDISISAISVVWIDARHLLPTTIPAGSVWIEFDSPVSKDTIQSTTQFVRNIYNKAESADGLSGAAVTAYHRIDPSVLWYVNTKGCRARCMLAAFCDRGAFAEDQRKPPCCDNCFYSQQATAEMTGPPTSAWMKASIRFFDTEDSRVERTREQIEDDQRENVRKMVKTSPAQELAVSQALDEFAFKTFGDLHRLLFPTNLRRRIASVGVRCISKALLAAEINSSAFNLENSALSPYADSIVQSITLALTTITSDKIPTQLLRSAPHHANRFHSKYSQPIC